MNNWLGAHQKINRLAYRGLKQVVLWQNEPVRARSKLSSFPTLKAIQHFEGRNGPDGLKIKSPGLHEPEHYYDPQAGAASPLIKLLSAHEKDLAAALKAKNIEKAAFEASWLAHTLVDGLTPAHHYPFIDELSIIRGEGKETQDSVAKKLVVKGSSTKDTLKKTWKLVGAKGLLSTHINFEAGVGSAVTPLRLPQAVPSGVELAFARNHGLAAVFMASADAIDQLELYERFYRNGWTTKLGRDVRNFLVPQMIKTVTLAWLLALEK